MHQPTQDPHDRNDEAGKLTISRIQIDEGTYKLPKINSEVVYLGDPRILGLEYADTKINTKGMSMECYALCREQDSVSSKKHYLNHRNSKSLHAK